MILISITFIVADNIDHQDNQDVLLLWQLPLIVASFTAVCVAGLAIINRKLLKPIQIPTLINLAVYLLTVTIFYSLNIDYLYIVTSGFSLLQLFIGLICL